MKHCSINDCISHKQIYSQNPLDVVAQYIFATPRELHSAALAQLLSATEALAVAAAY